MSHSCDIDFTTVIMVIYSSWFSSHFMHVIRDQRWNNKIFNLLILFLASATFSAARFSACSSCCIPVDWLIGAPPPYCDECDAILEDKCHMIRVPVLENGRCRHFAFRFWQSSRSQILKDRRNRWRHSREHKWSHRYLFRNLLNFLWMFYHLSERCKGVHMSWRKEVNSYAIAASFICS